MTNSTQPAAADILLSQAQAAINALQQHTSAVAQQSTTRLVWLERREAQALQGSQIAHMLAQWSAPIHGWWQTADHTGIATANQLGPHTAPDHPAWNQLMEGEWTSGLHTLQVKRRRHQLLAVELLEHHQPTGLAVPALVSYHALQPRFDKASQLTIATYAHWSDTHAQVTPFAQRLVQLTEPNRDASHSTDTHSARSPS